MPLSEKEELELLELEEEEANAAQANVPTQDAVSDGERPGIAERIWEGATAPLPGWGRGIEALRTDIPGAIAETTGTLAERTGPLLGPDIKTAGIATAGAIGMAGELLPKSAFDIALLAAGGPLGRGAGKLGAKMFPALEQRAPNVVKAIKAAMSANITPTITQILQSKPLAQVEEVMTRIPIIGRRIIAMREAQEAAYQNLRTSAITGAGPKMAGSELGAGTQEVIAKQLESQAAEREIALTEIHGRLLGKSGDQVSREQVGRELDNIITQKVEASRAKKNKLFEMVSDAIPPEADHVVAINLRNAAAGVLKSVRNLPSESMEGTTRRLLTELRRGPSGKVIENAADPIIKYFLAGEDAEFLALAGRKAYTFREVQTLREILNEKIHQRMVAGNRYEAQMFRKLKDSIDADIETFSDTLPSDIKRKFEVATTYYKNIYKGKYAGDDILQIQKLAKTDPENVYGMIVKPGDVSDIRRLKAAVGEAGMAPMRRRFLEETTTGQGGRVLTGPEIINNISKYGEQTLKELLSGEQFADLQRFAKTREMPRFVESMMEKKLRGVIQQSGTMYRAPEDVVQRVIDGDVATLRAVKRIVGPTGTVSYKRRIIEDILGEAQNTQALPGMIQQKTSFGVRRALKSYDENFLKEIFTKRELDEIERIDDIRALLESQPRLMHNAPNTASAMIAPAASGAIGTLAFFSPIKAAAVVIGSDVLSRLYVSETGRKLLIQGMDPRSAKNMPLYGRLIAAIANAKRDQSAEQRP